MKFRKFLMIAGKKFTAQYKAFLSWVLSDGGTVEARNYTNNLLKEATNASIVQIPSAYKAEVLYNQIPIVGDELLVNGDFANWTGDNPDGWGVAGTETGTTFVTENVLGCNIVTDAAYIDINQTILSVGTKYTIEINVIQLTGNITIQGFGAAVPISSTGITTLNLTASQTVFRVVRNVAPTDAIISSVSVKQVQDFTVARASDVTRTNEDGFLEVIGSNVPCIDYSCLLYTSPSPRDS